MEGVSSSKRGQPQPCNTTTTQPPPMDLPTPRTRSLSIKKLTRMCLTGYDCRRHLCKRGIPRNTLGVAALRKVPSCPSLVAARLELERIHARDASEHVYTCIDTRRSSRSAVRLLTRLCGLLWTSYEFSGKRRVYLATDCLFYNRQRHRSLGMVK